MCYRVHSVGRVWFIMYLIVCSDYQLAVLFKSKLVLTTISTGKKPDITF